MPFGIIIKPAAKAFNTIPKTVRKWLNKWKEGYITQEQKDLAIKLKKDSRKNFSCCIINCGKKSNPLEDFLSLSFLILGLLFLIGEENPFSINIFLTEETDILIFSLSSRRSLI
ncbi:MAG: hypothetical protein CBR30_03535 [Dictyoglomus sp. NZ13-RE01]|nr:MAG: hypothetical protein CBR30_03535 [Dictyoglomus sp. NZ13-RE01]